MYLLRKLHQISKRGINFRGTRFAHLQGSEDSIVAVETLSGDDKGIWIVGLNRPPAKNALNKELVNKLDSTFDTITFDKTVRAVILRSLVPGVFCAGADLKERLTLTDIEVQMFVKKLRTLMSKIENLHVPVIAAIDGHALGGGLEMALASDIRVASSSSKMGLVETKLAIIPGAGGTQRLPRIVGTAIAKELIFTSRIVSGAEAKLCGLVNHSVEGTPDKAYGKALEIAREIIANGPVGVKMAKKAITQGSEVDLDSGLAIEELCYAQVIPTNDRLEALTAFREKRKPVFTGK